MRKLLLLSIITLLSGCGSPGINILPQYTFVMYYSSCNMPSTTLKLSKVGLQKHIESPFNIEQRPTNKECVYSATGITEIYANSLFFRFLQVTKENTCEEGDLIWDKNYSYNLTDEELEINNNSCRILFYRVVE